jgi:hypothetical protein
MMQQTVVFLVEHSAGMAQHFNQILDLYLLPILK